MGMHDVFIKQAKPIYIIVYVPFNNNLNCNFGSSWKFRNANVTILWKNCRLFVNLTSERFRNFEFTLFQKLRILL